MFAGYNNNDRLKVIQLQTVFCW